MSRITEEVIFEAILGDMVDRIAEGNIEIMTIDIMITIEVGIGQGRGHSQGMTVAIELTIQVVVDLGQESRATTNRDRIGCYNCREYDCFVRDCPTSREERDLEQLQHVLNLEEEEQTYQSSSRHSSPMSELRTSPLNL